MIHTLKSQGLSVSEIARQLKVDRKTVRKYLRFNADDPSAMQRKPRTRKLAAYEPYLLERVHQFPTLTATRLMREIRELGYAGSYTILSDYLRQVRPRDEVAFEVRFETPPGHQAQTDFATFAARFERQPNSPRRIYLFTMVLGHSRYLWGRFCDNQALQTVIWMHIRAFEGFGGVPKEILYDRMKTAVIGEDANGEVIYNQSLNSLLEHYGALPQTLLADAGYANEKDLERLEDQGIEGYIALGREKRLTSIEAHDSAVRQNGCARSSEAQTVALCTVSANGCRRRRMDGPSTYWDFANSACED